MKILLALFGAMSVFFLLLFFRVKSDGSGSSGSMLKRMEFFSLDPNKKTVVSKLTKEQIYIQKLMKGIATVADKLKSVRFSSYFDFKMQQANWPLLGAEFMVILILVASFTGFILFLMMFDIKFFFYGVVGAPLVLIIYMKICISRRQSAFMNQLGDTLLMVSNALRAGFSFMQAMEYISREMSDPIGTEFRKVVNEMNLGSTLETSLENMGKRVESKDFDLVVTAVLIQRQVGGNLSQVLDNISNTISERIRMRREILALTSQGRLSGMIVGAIPIAMIFMLTSMDPNYFKPVTDSPTGRMLAVAAAVLEILAGITIRNIVNIKL